MLEVTKYESRRRARGAIVLTVGIGLFALLILGIYPSFAESGADFEAYIENLPPAIREGFVGTESITTLPGFLATEVYQFIWLLMLGLYMGYAGGGTVAGDVETNRIDLVLATPISRSRVVVEKFVSLLVPILVANLVMPLFVYAGVLAIGESLDFLTLLGVHVFSIPYLLACGGIGLVLSVVVKRADVAQRGAIAFVFLLFVLETVTTGTDYEWLGTVSPTRYFDPVEVLVEESYDVAGALFLLAGTVTLVLIAQILFERADV